GVEQSWEKAVEWYRKSAEQGNKYGQNNLGWCYEDGKGVEKNYKEAVRLYQLSARQGNETAQNNLKRLGEKW
ncbi:MAG: tetratricopeptide repeat protein, partial [Ruminococcus sp.]|nr:tetratricopeptide repeat protein [Ruminococcus sp.]